MNRFLPLFFFIVVLCWILGCSSTQVSKPFHTRIYDGNYDEVWVSTLKTLADYPLKLSNKDNGRIESEVVNGPYNDLLMSYPDKIELPERYRYSLSLNFAKFSTDKDGQPLTRIRIIKKLEKFQDFYSGWVSYPSDGLEERVLLYRVEHVLRMEKLLAKQVYSK